MFPYAVMLLCVLPIVLHMQRVNSLNKTRLRCVSFSVYSQQYTRNIYPSPLHEPSSKPEGATVGKVQQAIVEGVRTTMHQGLLDAVTVQTIKERESNNNIHTLKLKLKYFLWFPLLLLLPFMRSDKQSRV